MALPLVIGYHLVWAGYGWWLPNDPRGSMSNCIKCDLIAELGELHFGRKRVQPASREIRTFYERAIPRLKFAQVTFHPEDVNQIVLAFAREIEAQRYTCYACAIMPDHVHILIRKHKHQAEEMIQNLHGRVISGCATPVDSIGNIRSGADRGGRYSWTALTTSSGQSNISSRIR